ncbi:bifunctional adenosylcobinamide kinase/adenosylcobinamide-phosphate guanylyltransferase [Paenibacillus chartarius]|uniref:Adenosylcobinamide kinase n=1 Tax=Paenibacillus chartarius TaxID=747481 RepID=A0ABV6DFU3_9BACL
MLTLVTGGARSGKSGFAERLVMHEHREAVYIATGQAYDSEMQERIALHRQERESSGFAWTTIEEPLELGGLLRRDMWEAASAVLVDCLTLWLSNRLLRAEHEADIDELLQREISELVETAAAFPGRLTLVTNEVGSGIVPEYKLGRQYRDYAGRLNRLMAERAERVFLVTAGIPVELKSMQYRFPDRNGGRL